ncbi:hypothetical protein MPER_02112, partial [Moniliophthora perniciosa FA553]
AAGKLKVRERKRGSNMPEELRWVKDAKYDHAFEVNHMSDDDDVYDDQNNVVKNKYLARAPMHRSEKLQELFDVIDQLPDPAPSGQYWIRVKGEPKEQPIRRAAAFGKRGRRWMYKPEWLDANKEYACEAYVLDNGLLWGDPTDPVEQEDMKKEVKAAKKEKKRKS